jgi:hypothetical protein
VIVSTMQECNDSRYVCPDNVTAKLRGIGTFNGQPAASACC